ncbi:MAG: hypothetical protein HKN33_13245 [Pyrinomonadaceae bacterium]|nr:hypothetical protein [Pyrinomonadaceae bacterium]
MSISKEIEKDLGANWIPSIYETEVMQLRTRAFDLAVPQKENSVEIVHTLLGIQLKTGSKLIACPDLSTARYLRVFVRIGCPDVAVPYDITRISSIADALESAWHTALLMLDEKMPDASNPSKARVRSALIKSMRTQVINLGPGDLMPKFDTETKQRKDRN